MTTPTALQVPRLTLEQETARREVTRIIIGDPLPKSGIIPSDFYSGLTWEELAARKWVTRDGDVDTDRIDRDVLQTVLKCTKKDAAEIQAWVLGQWGVRA